MTAEPLLYLRVGPEAAELFGLTQGVYVLAVEVAGVIQRLEPDELERFAGELERLAEELS